MNAFICCTSLFLVGQFPPDYRDRDRHPLAPSLPRLTKDEYAKIDDTIERFIQYDIGKLKGAAGKKALDDFNRLGPEAVFNLIDGFNRAANMESSCPAVIIGRKIAGVVKSTEDVPLLTFAKENIGAGVTAKRHINVIRDLHFNILLRKSALQRHGVTAGAKVGAARSDADLEKAIANANGPQLKSLLTQAEKRNGAKAVDLLLTGLASAEPDIAKLSKGLLAKNLQHQPTDVLKAILKHNSGEVRAAAATAIGAKKLRYGQELIGLLQDNEDDVRQAARRALVQISGGVDHGPSPDASSDERASAAARWREWWRRQN